MGPTILVVDDNLIMCSALKAVLQRAGYHVLIARDAQIALETTLVARLDLIITDLELPVVNGLELVRMLRQKPERLSSLPIIVLTAWDHPESRVTAIDLGCVAFLTKPVANTTLLETISAALARHGEDASEILG